MRYISGVTAAVLLAFAFGLASGRPAQDAPANPAVVPAPREDPGWRSLNDMINARTRQGAQKGDIDLLFIGDSITQGWSGAGSDAWKRHFGPAGAANLGIGGDQTQHVIWRLKNGNLEGLAKPASGKSPRVAIVMIGTNNLGSGQNPEQVAEGVKAVLSTIHAQLPEVQVLLLGILPRSERSDEPLRLKVAATNKLLQALAGEQVHYFDSGGVFLQSDGWISRDIMPDFLHLSPAGYEMWAQAIKPQIAKLLGE